MCKELELYATVVNAQCISVSENFATMESDVPMTATELQEMLEQQWESMYAPVLVGEGTTSPVFHQTFKKIIFHG
jgi:hypothetical protein